MTIARARAEWYAADEGIFDFLRDALTMDLIKPGRPPHSAPRVRRFALKLQQFTGPLMAKSLEDTAFYRFHRLLALNEVGGDPAAKALTIPDFHDMMQARAREWPHGMTATATHDTKRGEDARARLMALTEISGEWTSAVARWKLLNAPRLVTDGEMRAPSVAAEYMLYQTLLGAWPAGRPGCRLHRTHPGLCAEGRARRQGADELAQSARGLRRRPEDVHRTYSRSPQSGEFLQFDRGDGAPHRTARRAQFAQPAYAEGDHARRARFLSGHRVLGPVAGRS